MTKDDLFLPVEMGRLEIEPVKVNKSVIDENPFINNSQHRKGFPKRTLVQSFKCSCSRNNNRNMTICKKKHKRILKEPVLKFLHFNCSKNVRDEYQSTLHINNVRCLSSHSCCTDSLSLCALVDNCNQLRISSDSNDKKLSVQEVNNDTKWWKREVSVTAQSKEVTLEKSRAGPSCSQQALNPTCDITIDELASYFETLVHIPKKMSSMAEMMYI